ncbi:phage tail assembly chaperone [Fusobacterium polymorphum]|jgi:xkdN-like protein|uniref:phage tail assembly chaperone n=1 Tax=Fusobacterium nucleatum subsp. polymorphum TaxID=76857 RepID=UPI003008D801
MTNMEVFLKQNAVQKENKKVVVSERFKDEDGKVVEWEIRPLTAQEDQILREANTEIKELKGKKGQLFPQLDSNKYSSMLIAACVVFPDLQNQELQDSYGVKNKPDLLTAMLLPGEFQDLFSEVQKINGFKTLEDLTEEAKN